VTPARMLNPLHLSRIERRTHADNVQHRAECTGCAYVGMWWSYKERADEDAARHAETQREKAAEKKPEPEKKGKKR
jgi:hypothetical protein